MRFHESELPGVFVVDIEPKLDERGFFARTFAEEEFAAHRLPSRFPHWSISRNTYAATLRGLHYNAAPFREAKLVRCTRGAIWDVVVDLRRDSPTRFGWRGLELSGERGNALFVPEGFAHGFVTLGPETDVFYYMTRPYEPSAARGLRWDDPRLGIRWPVAPKVLSERDRSFADFSEESFDG